jgi:hypothetical protein
MVLAAIFAGSTPTSAQRSFVRLQPDVIVDPNGFGSPIAAATLLTPVGWRASGGVAWGRQYGCTHGFAINWRIVAPDGLSGIVLLPHQRWEYSSVRSHYKANISCPVLRISNVSDYLRIILSKIRPDARVVRIQPRRDILQTFPNHRYTRPWQFGRQIGWMEAAEIVFTVTEKGVPLEGRLTAAIQFEKTITRTSALNSELVIGYAHTAYATFAPRGRYNYVMFEFIRRLIKPDPRWTRLIAQHNAIIRKIDRDGFRRRNQILTQANREIMDIITSGWRRRQKIQERGHREFIKTLRDVEVYRDPLAPGGEVELSNHYRHAWRLRDGTYVLTDSSGFHPGRDLGIDGERLTPVR